MIRPSGLPLMLNQSIKFQELSEAQKLCVVAEYHRDTGRDRSFRESLQAFYKVLSDIALRWDPETGEPSLGSDTSHKG